MIRVCLNRTTNFTQSETKKLASIIPYLEKVLNSEEFKQAVVSFKYEENEDYTMGHSGEQIYQSIAGGKEVLSGEADGEVDIDLTIYSVPWWKGGKNTIGYTYPSTLRTWINRKYFSMFSGYEIAGNIMHEYMHKLGYGHSFVWTNTRDKSVPYAIGYMVSDLVEKIWDGK